MNLNITILVDNRAAEELLSEHGFSLWIDTGYERILFDTGQGDVLAHNAAKLGIEYEHADFLILSHGHFDHTGGIPNAIQHFRNTVVYCHPGVMKPRYIVTGGAARAIQMPQKSMAAIDNMPAQNLYWVSQSVLTNERIGIACPIPRETGYEDTGGSFYLDPEGLHEDSIDDDLALWIKTDDGLVVCVGCSHAGLINTLNYIRRLNPDSRIRAVIGGFHLLNAGKERLDLTISALQSFLPIMLSPCHCTGNRATEALKEAFGDQIIPGYAGARYNF